MKLVVLITTHTQSSLHVADEWQNAGAPGVTIIDTHGVQGLKRHKHQQTPELALAVSMSSILHQIQKTNVLLFSVVEDHMVDQLIQIAEQSIGDLTEPENGIAFVLDVERVIGMPKRKPTS